MADLRSYSTYDSAGNLISTTTGSTSSITMADAKYGRESNNEIITKQMESILKGLASYMTGMRYNNVITTIRKNWAGQDAEEFIKNFESRIATLKTELVKKYTNMYLAGVQNNITLFKSNQAKNSANLKF